ncbi:uncharacterized protein LOC129589395 isoform X1 [Paramacrobiotus metropolitanus]|uniref:uncharacterized protein LOC129589395 isoform X1 n=1 Tax=Paramacrobiotus metropolitanus TaxID=2943436 RepID=UPI00244641F8|nr:uncharacterized protein LOC129589395 isoform X1 [Paramacrobiotus metropolitanus]
MIMKEVQANHARGPFKVQPHPNFVVNPLGLRPKRPSGHRVIMDLSQPFGLSVNDFIPKDKYSLTYVGVDDAVKMVMFHGRGSLMAKVDIESAFRNLPVRQSDWHLLGYEWEGQFYHDVVVPFGLRSGPYLFDTFARMLEWIFKKCTGSDTFLHFLDDFFMCGKAASWACGRLVMQVQSVCKYLGVPINEKKLVGPATVIEFLGVEINSESFTLSVSAARLAELTELLESFSACTQCTKRELLSLIGKLSFVTKCIPASRIFLRRMIQLSCKVNRLYHRITLTEGFRRDVAWWREFLPAWNGTAGFVQPEWLPASVLHLYTDAAGAIGFGGTLGNEWFQGAWPGWLLKVNPPITFLEMYPIYVACVIWNEQLCGKRVLFHCDNTATAQTWSAGSCRNPAVMELIRRIHFVTARFNFIIRITHIAGVDNSTADALSRFQLQRFRQLHPSADANGMSVPDLLTRLKPFLIGKEPPITTSTPALFSPPEWLLLPEELTQLESEVSSSFADQQ